MIDIFPNFHPREGLTILVLRLEYVISLSLSPVERLVLGSRLDSIQNKVRQDVQPLLVENDGLKDIPVDVVIIFPGAGGPDQLTSELCENILNRRRSLSCNGNCVYVFDWSEHRGSVATAAFDAEAVGESVADGLLAENNTLNIRSIHSIGISVGGFAGNQFATRCKELNPKVYVRLTLLDPFCSRGIFGFGYGQNYFGLNVDYAEHILNTDDPVPTTNDPLQHCVVYDVTHCKERESFILPENETMHCWPVAFYSRFGVHTDIDTDRNVKLPSHDHDSAASRGVVLTR